MSETPGNALIGAWGFRYLLSSYTATWESIAHSRRSFALGFPELVAHGSGVKKILVMLVHEPFYKYGGLQNCPDLFSSEPSGGFR